MKNNKAKQENIGDNSKEKEKRVFSRDELNKIINMERQKERKTLLLELREEKVQMKKILEQKELEIETFKLLEQKGISFDVMQMIDFKKETLDSLTTKLELFEKIIQIEKRKEQNVRKTVPKIRKKIIIEKIISCYETKETKDNDL